MTITAPRQLDLLDFLESEPAPLASAEAAVVESAVRECARTHAEFSVADVRPFYAREVRPNRVGTTFSALVKRGVIVAVDVARSGNTAQRNGRKLVNLYRLATTERDGS